MMQCDVVFLVREFFYNLDVPMEFFQKKGDLNVKLFCF